MALWIQKHEPQKMDQLSCHPHINERLAQMAASGNIPNLVLYGQPGSGRKTRIRTFLHAIFGPGIHQLKASMIPLENTTAKAEIYQISSNFHVEVSADEMGRNDKTVVSQLVKKSVGQTSNLWNPDMPSFRVVVIKDADQLTFEAQAALRRTMEVNHKNCRIFLVAESLSKLIKPLRSRCLCLRVPLPTNDEILDVLKKVAIKEALTPKVEYLVALVKVCRRNLERSLLLLELASVQNYPDANSFAFLPWELSVSHMVKSLITSPTPQTILDLRNQAYELYASNIPMSQVLELCHRLLMAHLSDKMQDLRLEISRFAFKFGEAMGSCQNEVIQLEAFMASAAHAIRFKQIESGL